MRWDRVLSDALLAMAITWCSVPVGAQMGQAARLVGSDSAVGDAMGTSVAISGDTAVVGAPGTDDGSGVAHVFSRVGGPADGWTQVVTLVAGDADAEDDFGAAVALAGDLAIVGHARSDGGVGAAYLFSRQQGGPDAWGEIARLVASDRAELDFFGSSVAVTVDAALIGARYADGGVGLSGSAYLFERSQGGPDQWAEVAKVVTTTPEESAHFGHSVSLSADRAVVGAPLHHDVGIAYLFDREVVFLDGFETGTLGAW